MKLIRAGRAPRAVRTDAYLLQEYVRGVEITIAIMRAHVGAPVRIVLPEGTPYSFLRKYVSPPQRAAVTDDALVARIRATAARVAVVLEIDWAARIDLILEHSGRLCILECDAAPLVGTRSVFAMSLAQAGVERARQLRLLLNEET